MIRKIKDLENIAGIYKINYPNGKIYIGQSQNIKKRILEHNQRARKIESNRTLQACDAALRKYNYEIEEIEILEEIKDLKIMDERESYWINFYKSSKKDIGYNIVTGRNVSSKRGTEHPNAAFNEEQLKEVIDLLMFKTELSYEDIAKKYCVNKDTIYDICTERSYTNPLLNYPLRTNNHDSVKKNEVLDYFSSEEELIKLKEDLFFRWDLTIEEDLVKKYNIPLRVLRDINQGRKFEAIGNFTYPIRTKNIRNIHNVSIADIQNILKELRTTTKSCTVIGEPYGFHRDTISKINKGLSYPIKNYDYPARK